MARIQQQPAYVLHPRAYRETSLILEVFSRDHGRVAMVARGAKSVKSRWRNLLQPFRPLLLGWNSRGDLGTLTSADQVAAPPALHGEALYCGIYVNELLMRLLHKGDPHPEVFGKYREVLAALAAGESPQPVLRLFEKHLLEDVGYGLLLDREAKTDRLVESKLHYKYSPAVGAEQVNDAASSQADVFSGKALLALHTEQLSEEVLPELRRLMRKVMRYHLGDKPLASQALFGSVGKRGQSKV
jgi:DNA repair protein RecO (recombination protein O)